MSDETSKLPDVSQRLMAEAEAVRDLEREKRGVPISTPEFHRLADEIERRARQVFRLAADEEITGDGAPTQDRSIDEVARERLPSRRLDEPG